MPVVLYPASVRVFRFAPVFFLAAVLISACGSPAASDVDPVVVVEVGGPMDERLIDSVVEAIGAPNVHMFVLKIDSPGVSSGDLADGLRAFRLSGPGPRPGRGADDVDSLPAGRFERVVH